MMKFLSSLLSKNKPIDVKKLPSMGYFYNDDFNIKIKKASDDDIKYYLDNYPTDITFLIERIKKIVKNNIIIPKPYDFIDIRSIDIIYIFLEIVKLTKNKKIYLKYYNDKIGKDCDIEFSEKTFNYFNFSDDLMKSYSDSDKQFVIDGFKFSLPSIGIEDSIVNFLNSVDDSKYDNYEFDFMYFMGNKPFLTFEEVDNIMGIFNEDIDINEKNKLKNIINTFKGMQRYGLLDENNKQIDINSKLNFKNIWND